jgi:hypothetical protein
MNNSNNVFRRIAGPVLLACVLSGCSGLELVIAVMDAAILLPPGNPVHRTDQPKTQTVSAGPDQVVTEGDTVKLISSVDASIDSQKLDYEWKKTIGPKITMDTSERGTASFVAPPAKKTRTLTIRLKARAENGNVYEDSAVVVVKPASLSDSLQ